MSNETKKHKFYSKVVEFVARVVTIKDTNLASEDIIKYDSDNKFPQRLLEQLSESGTATACIEALNQYSYAEGLTDKYKGDLKVNEEQTLNDLIEDILSQGKNVFDGVAIHVMRDGSGNIISSKVIEFANCRKTANSIVYNPTLSSKEDKTQEVKYCQFQGAKVTTEQLEKIASYKNAEKKTVGEIFYYYKKKPGKTIYPVPAYYANISDINADAENSKIELETANNSFMASAILNVPGEIDDTEKGDDGKTDKEALDESIEAFTGNSKDSKGETGRQKILVLNPRTKEEAATLIPLTSEGAFNAIDKSSIRVAGKVAMSMGVPPFIIGLGGNVGFATNIIADNIALFNNRITISQKFALTVVKKLYPELTDLAMTQLNPVKYIQPEVLAKLTDAELRELGGYKTEENKATSEVSLAQTLGTGSTTSLVEILKDTALTRDQKLNTLEILFNIPTDKATKLVGDVIQPVNN